MGKNSLIPSFGLCKALIVTLLLTACAFKKDSENGAGENKNTESIEVEDQLPQDSDLDGDMVLDSVEARIGLDSSIPNIPKIIPSEMKAKLEVVGSDGVLFVAKSDAKGISHELQKRISTNVLEKYFEVKTGREEQIDAGLLSSTSLLELSLRERETVLEKIEGEGDLDARLVLGVNLEFDGFWQISKYSNLIGAISLLNKATGDIEEIINFTFKTPTGGDLQVDNLQRTRFDLDLSSSVPVFYLSRDDLRDVMSDRKEILFSIKGFHYLLNGNVYSFGDVFNSVNSVNSLFFFGVDEKIQYTFTKKNQSLDMVLKSLEKKVKFDVSGEILNVDEIQSTNISAINPDLLKEYEFSRRSWYGLEHGNFASSSIEEDISGLVSLSNIDLALGLNKGFEKRLGMTNIFEQEFLKNDVAIIRLKKIRRRPVVRNEEYVVSGRYKRWYCVPKKPIGGARDRFLEKGGSDCSANEDARSETGDTTCRAMNIIVDGVEDVEEPFSQSELDLLLVRYGDEAVSLATLFLNGDAFLSSDRKTIVLEIRNEDSPKKSFSIFTERKRDVKIKTGHSHYIGSCDIDHFASTVPNGTFESKDADFFGFAVDLTVMGINRLSSTRGGK